MPAQRLIKHNPLFMSDDQLEDTFVVRTAELQILADLVRANRGEVNQHALVIGPRGMGKTMLIRRLALLIRSDRALSDKWYPIVAPEEIYDAANEGEIWLAIIRSLADQERRENGEFERWNERHEALLKEQDDERLRVRTLGALTEFSHARGKRLLVLIENLQMLLGEQFAKDADWDLRKTLLNRSEIMLVLTATTRFEQIEQPAFAAYELLRELELPPLSTEGCRRLWQAVSGQNLTDQRIRPLEILTGGNPRLLAILATFAPERPLKELMENLAELIDDHTPFLKSNIDALAPQERRVFVNLAKLWEPSTARRVGELSRLNSNTASAVLKSLVNRGAVVEQGKEGRGKLYQVTERIYCIYYLMRLAGSEADRMRAFVRFMVPLYGEDSLARSLAEAACSSDSRGRVRFIEGYQISAYSGDFETPGTDPEPKTEPSHEGGGYPIEAGISENIDSVTFHGSFLPNRLSRMPEGLAGQWDEAFAQMKPWVDDVTFVKDRLDNILVFLIDAAADGQAKRALEELSGTAAERAMEPLMVALKDLVGEKYRAPQEVEEVKNDVLARIEERRQALSELRARFREIGPVART